MAGHGCERGSGRGRGNDSDSPVMDQVLRALAQSVQQGKKMQHMFMQYLQGQQQNAQNNQYDPFSSLSFGLGKGVTKRYDGSLNPEKMVDYFRDMEKNFANVNVQDHHKVRLAEHYLERDPDDWWQITK
jgi:hypothetical protein